MIFDGTRALTPPSGILLSPRDSLGVLFSPECQLPTASKLLAEAIIQRGRVFMHQREQDKPMPILDVTSFINCGVDTDLMVIMAKELAGRLERFEPEIILTAPASGIAPAFAVARELRIPMCYAQDNIPVTFRGKETHSVNSHSPTKEIDTTLAVPDGILPSDRRVVVIDDILRTGKKLQIYYR